MIIVVLAFVFLVVRSIINVHKAQVTTGKEGMIGEEGIALSEFTDSGKISVHGEIWNAECPGGVNKGDKLVIERVEGMTLIVRKK